MFSKLLIANRGEIAVRIIRACREMGIRSVAVYSEADAGAMHVRLADEAVPIGQAAPAESYLRSDKIIEAAKAAGAEAIHPGYGFLSENAEFAAAVRAAGLVFVGPTPQAIRAMGDKIQARRLVQAAGVPVVPEYVPGQSNEAHFPLLVKASAGGGGRGMRIVRSQAELAEALESAEREARQAFGDGTLFLETYIEHAHHVELQILGDIHGNLVHLNERECSIQRRHQKIIEETPSPLLDRFEHAGVPLRAQMAEAALAAARAANYTNAGTVEFIVDPQTGQFYFLEMNTRLQVEHPITELVNDLDLVKAQIRIAAGQPLPFKQEDVRPRGHAIECRLYAEDPAHDFLPSTGPLLKFVEPRGPGLRVDSGFETGDHISHHYDALIAKIVAYAQSRPEALARMKACQAETTVLGINTNLLFLQEVLADPTFERGEAPTNFIESRFADWQPAPDQPTRDLAVIAAVLSTVEGATPKVGEATPEHSVDASPWARADGFRLGARG